jgi:hypothetical protein
MVAIQQCGIKPSELLIPQCAKCGRRHRSWWKLAECLLHPTIWTQGRGPWASVSDCPREPYGGATVMLHMSKEAAERAKQLIDGLACGGRCRRLHRVVNLLEIGETE